jgi:hypothetical protein
MKTLRLNKRFADMEEVTFTFYNNYLFHLLPLLLYKGSKFGTDLQIMKEDEVY